MRELQHVTLNTLYFCELMEFWQYSCIAGREVLVIKLQNRGIVAIVSMQSSQFLDYSY